MPGRRSSELAARLDLHSDSAPDDENWDFRGEPTQELLHNLHPYPARFIPQIPRRAILRWTRPGDLVLDPFCGSGTTLLESRLAARDSIGVDNNGVATLVARAKVLTYQDADLDEVLRAAGQISTVQPAADDSFTTDYPNLAKWFTPAAVQDLLSIRAVLDTLGEEARTLASAVFSSLIVRSSRQDSDTRYAAGKRRYAEGWAIRTWKARCHRAVDRARLTQAAAQAAGPSHHKVLTQDSRDLAPIEDATVALVATSPPYLNAYDYHKYHRHRLHWVGADVALARDVEIGKHDIFSRPNAIPDPYFADMRACMAEWFRVLRPGGRALIVVGDGIVASQFVPVGNLLTASAASLGFELERRWLRAVDSGRKSFNRDARIKREHLLLLRKPE